jgi:hypothetical protein
MLIAVTNNKRRPSRSAIQPATGENNNTQMAGIVRMPPMTR